MNVKPDEILMRDYNYELPADRIAEFPLEKRDASRLLVYKSGKMEDDRFAQLASHLPKGATVVFNNTRVIEARLLFQKETGGIIEIFCLQPHQTSIEQAMQQKEQAVWECLIGGASKWKAGQVLKMENGGVVLFATYLEKRDNNFLVEFSWQPVEAAFAEILHAVGAIPLPPYIKRKAAPVDKERYQTVFSKHDGSVAAPTAALHFTDDVLNSLQQKSIDTAYVTLHVGAGTFQPVKSATIAGHQMHGEPFRVEKKVIEQLRNSKKIIAVGTTSMRTLESLYWLGVKLHLQPEANPDLEQWEAYELEEKAQNLSKTQSLQYLLDWLEQQQLDAVYCRTSIIIVPGYQFRLVQGLITNFHQPQSTLLLLIAAFIGAGWKQVYEHALQQQYRFLSYGDSSLLWRSDQIEME